MLTHRDARDRVRTTDRGELPAMLAEAEAVGDSVLAKAVAERAMRERDLDLVNLYVERHPHEENDYQALWDLTEPALGPDIATAMTYEVPPPAEVDGLDDWKLRESAEAS